MSARGHAAAFLRRGHALVQRKRSFRKSGGMAAAKWAFNLDDMAADIYKRTFILLGFFAFCLLIPLGVTSTNNQVKRVGGKRWKMLHRSAYVINVLVAFHFIFAATHENGEPYVYALVVAVLLGYRFRQWRKKQAAVAVAVSP